MAETARYIIGIDLGTTNSALAFVDTALPAPEREVQIFQVPQLTAPGEFQERPVLPSFVYLPEPDEIDPALLRLPWSRENPDFAVGELARNMAAAAPHRVVSSAKSWLCQPAVDRRGAVLPFDPQGGGRRISPVRAAQMILEHFRDAWNHVMAAGAPENALENQQVFLTVPASFDAVGRTLTVEAAEAAGIHVTLLEEPVAAFYAWLHDRGESWREQVVPGDSILVCDIGGGTTDFTLIAVTEEDGTLGLQRIAVGDHILLGGDNMDLTLAYSLSRRLQQERGIRLDPYQFAALTHACREAKESLTAQAPEPRTLTILGRGSGVIGGSIRVELRPEDTQTILLDGFFPNCAITDTPARSRRVGLRTLGLDYASDPAVSRHLAAFLAGHGFRDAGGRILLPAAVLFNGGVMRSPIFRRRILDLLAEWNSGEHSIQVLEEAHPDLAVAAGAAWYGHTRSTGGVRIRAGSAQSYYIGVESSIPAVPGFPPPIQALCVVPFGMEEGSKLEIPASGLGLVVGETSEFPFYTSTRRTEDAPGDILDSWSEDELRELPALVAELPVSDPEQCPPGTLVPVRLESVLTEVGVLELWGIEENGSGRWKLELDLRAVETRNNAEPTDRSGPTED